MGRSAGDVLRSGRRIEASWSGHDQDLEGHAFLGSSKQGADEFAAQVLQRLKPRLVGRDPLDIGYIWLDLWKFRRVVDARSICAVDVALWDIAGQAAGLNPC